MDWIPTPEPGKVFFLAYWLLAPVPIEDARDYAHSVKDTPEFEQSRNERKKVEMRFAHLKINHRFERMRLRGLTDARDEFHLAAIVKNLTTLANYVWRPPPDKQAAACAT
jgi:hypothetical protein